MLLAFAALLLTPGAADGAAVSARVAAAPAASRDAKALAEVLVPEQSMLRLAADTARRGVAGQVPPTDPALVAHVSDTLVEEVSRLSRKELPGFRREVAGLLQEDLSKQELADALAFFASPTGTRMMGVVYEAIAENPGRAQADTEKLVTQRMLSRMQPQDLSVMMAFGASPVAGKARAAAARVSAAGRAWSDRFVAKHRARLDKLVARETNKYLRDHPARTERGA